MLSSEHKATTRRVSAQQYETKKQRKGKTMRNWTLAALFCAAGLMGIAPLIFLCRVLYGYFAYGKLGGFNAEDYAVAAGLCVLSAVFAGFWIREGWKLIRDARTAREYE